jgi:hypothetical protein
MHLNPQTLEVVVAETVHIFPAKHNSRALDEFRIIDQSLSIVAETEPILNRRNSLLKSRSQISHGSRERCFCHAQKKFATLYQGVTTARNNRVGVATLPITISGIKNCVSPILPCNS